MTIKCRRYFILWLFIDITDPLGFSSLFTTFIKKKVFEKSKNCIPIFKLTASFLYSTSLYDCHSLTQQYFYRIIKIKAL